MLKIKAKEWLYILVLALVLGFSIAGFTSSLYNYDSFPFVLFGLANLLLYISAVFSHHRDQQPPFYKVCPPADSHSL